MNTKRIFDLCCVLPSLILLSPLFLLIALWVKLDSQGPIFFLQTRIGQFEKPFKIIKFRTMLPDNKGPKLTLNNDARITRCGHFLRRYKLDELPQLINVLKGEMSLVGPRPEVPEYVAYYPDALKEYVLSVPVGITDYASIEFHNESELLAASKQPEISYIENILPLKLAYHQKYVKEQSLYLDIVLIFKTLKRIFFK
ncbi:MAG: sugar transferase [Candidatus Parabeggiatoa sp. nov. 3]|nr:MAG: sugar transferase [Gammaproteobacteria bacterium]RKZ65883.1 MAG: sugar transferase [Gammaproteobacteria bacterium]RKZ80946.1 MAG: sugar transferase [Gammaproteobacteria bacterium]